MANPISPEYLARSGSEHGHQSALFCWAALQKQQFPQLEWMHAIGNGGGRSASQGSILKAEGVKGGVADICLPCPGGFTQAEVAGRSVHYSGLYIEMKKPAGIASDVSKAQRDFARYVLKNGFYWMVCFDWFAASQLLTAYLTCTGYAVDERQAKVMFRIMFQGD